MQLVAAVTSSVGLLVSGGEFARPHPSTLRPTHFQVTMQSLLRPTGRRPVAVVVDSRKISAVPATAMQLQGHLP